MRRVLCSIIIGITWFACTAFFQSKGENIVWYHAATTAGFAACVGYFTGYGDGKRDV